MLTIKKIAAPLAALVLPVLLATSALAQDKMMGHKMDGGKMMSPKMGGKMMDHKMMGHSMMSVKGLVPVHGAMLSSKALMGAKVVKTTMMMGHPCYDVKLKSGRMVQMCKATDKKMMMSHSMSGGKMMGGKMSVGKMHGGKMMDHKMGGKM